MNKTHWKKISNPNYLGSWDIPESGSLIIEIVSVSQEVVVGLDGKPDQLVVAKIKGNKPFILNATNKRAITKALKSPYIEDWVGKLLCVRSHKIRAFGEDVDALRVSTDPVRLPELTKSHEKWVAVLDAVRNGTKREAVEKKFVVSDSVWVDLNND